MAVTYSGAAGLGILQGLTEFLPVSSSGHLRLAETWLGGIDEHLALDVSLHLGTLLAVFLFYRADLIQYLTCWTGTGEEKAQARREVGFILLASIPTALLGLGLKKWGVESLGPVAVAGGLLGTAAMNWSTSYTRGGEQPLTAWRALVIGVVQGVAVLPGVSRSGSTIATSMMLGMDPVRAARFSFLCSIPAISGAALLTFKDAVEGGGSAFSPGPLALGILLSFVVGYACLEILMRQLQAGSFRIWAVYCFVLSLLVLYRTGVLTGVSP